MPYILPHEIIPEVAHTYTHTYVHTDAGIYRYMHTQQFGWVTNRWVSFFFAMTTLGCP